MPAVGISFVIERQMACFAAKPLHMEARLAALKKISRRGHRRINSS